MRINNPAAARMPTAMHRIRLIHVHGTARAAGIIHGVPERPIEDVSFVNCAVSADTGLSIEHAGRIDTSGLALMVKQGVPIAGP